MDAFSRAVPRPATDTLHAQLRMEMKHEGNKASCSGHGDCSCSPHCNTVSERSGADLTGRLSNGSASSVVNRSADLRPGRSGMLVDAAVTNRVRAAHLVNGSPVARTFLSGCAVTACGLEAAIIICVIARHRSGRWPSVLSYCIVNLLASLIAYHYRLNGVRYFYTYYTAEGLSVLLRIWVMWDVLRSIPGRGLHPRNAWIVLLSMAAALIAGCTWMAVGEARTPVAFLNAVTRLNIACSYIWMAFFMACLWTVKREILSWSRDGIQIVQSLTAQASTAILGSLLLTGTAVSLVAGYLIGSAMAVFVLIAWLLCFIRKPETLSLPERIASSLPSFTRAHGNSL